MLFFCLVSGKRIGEEQDGKETMHNPKMNDI